jgi:hypothetical protein
VLVAQAARAAEAVRQVRLEQQALRADKAAPPSFSMAQPRSWFSVLESVWVAVSVARVVAQVEPVQRALAVRLEPPRVRQAHRTTRKAEPGQRAATVVQAATTLTVQSVSLRYRPPQ